MKKTFLLILVTLLVACADTEIVSVGDTPYNKECFVFGDGVYSNAVTLEEARTELEFFLSDNSSEISKSSNSFSNKRIAEGFAMKLGKQSLSKSSADGTEAKIYVFNFEDDGGFAIMSATRETPPIFAVTDGGNIDTTKEIDCPGLAIFITNLETKLLNGELNYETDTIYQDADMSLSKQYTPSKTVQWCAYSAPKEKKFYKLSSGLCPYWHQDDPYNTYCPYDTIHIPVLSKDTRKYRDSIVPTYVGCVGVACGLLMATYRYPKAYNGRNFHWDDMINGINNDDVAWLLKRLGDSTNLNTTYKHGSSPSSSANIPRTFKNFGYSCGGNYGSYYTDVICRELKNGYPVLISGSSFRKDSITPSGNPIVLYESGHQWIGQGLLEIVRDVYHYVGEREYTTFKGMTTETDHYILCNMGWGYSRKWNGYYLSKVFDTNTGCVYPENYSKSTVVGTKYNYQYYFMSVTGIRK